MRRDDRLIRVMAYEVRPNDVLRIPPTPIAREDDYTVYETSFNDELGMLCLNVSGRRHYFEPGDQLKLNLTLTFEGWSRD